VTEPAAAPGLFRDFMLLVITLLLGTIGWGIRKWYHDLSDTLDEVTGQLEANRQQIKRNQTTLFGREATPWNGYNAEIQRNRRAIRNHRTILETHADGLKRHHAALAREGLIDPDRGSPEPDPADLDDVPQLNTDYATGGVGDD